MKQLNIVFMDEGSYNCDINILSQQMDRIGKLSLDQTPWSAYPYKPGVNVSIAHGHNCLLLKYRVTERELRTMHNRINSPVYEDSCVECFISFDNTGYYNLEFNAAGACLAGFGAERNNRTLLPEELLRQTRYCSHITNTGENIYWQLMLIVPLQVFCMHEFGSLRQQKATANFYKCGDGHQQPHYLAWAPVEAPAPDFHLSRFFAPILFE